MRSLIGLLLTIILTACLTIETKPPTPPPFVTSTLPPIPSARSTPTIIPTDAPTLPRPANCKDAAILLQDVTIPDGAGVPTGQPFTKTWRLRNTGTCPWDGKYSLAFLKGERMGAPDSVPVPITAPNSDAEISIPLIAPSADGIYTAYFELLDPSGKTIPIGLEQSAWVRITVGDILALPPLGGTPAFPPSSCAFSLNEGYVYQLLDLINSARWEANVPSLKMNPQLTLAAQGHSQDMACNNFLGHFGSDGSMMHERIIASGYPLSGFMEIIAIGTPQDAMNQWRGDPDHWGIVIDAALADIGIGYAYYAQSDYGGYFTVDMGTQR